MIKGNIFQGINSSMIINIKEGRQLEIYKNDFIGCRDLKIIIQSTLIINFSDNRFLNLTQTQSQLFLVQNQAAGISNFTNNNFQDVNSVHSLFKIDSSNSNFTFKRIFFLNVTTHQQSLIHSTSSSCYILLKDLNLRKANTALISVKGFKNQIHIVQLTTFMLSSHSSLIKAEGRLNALRLDSCQVYESNFTSSSARFVEGIDDTTQVVKSQFYRMRGVRSMFLNARIEMCQFKEITSEESLVKVDTKGALITNSNFQDNISRQRGAILSIKGTGSEIIVFNSTFKGNTAVMGGVAFLDKNSTAKFYDCSFESNYATVGGVFYGEYHRSLLLQNYLIINNSAIASSILYSQLSFENITFITGYIAANNEITKINTSQARNLSWPHQYNISPLGTHAIRMIEGKLYVIKTLFENQPNILSATASSMTFENTIITDSILERSTMIQINSDSMLQLTNVSITNITSKENLEQSDLTLFSLQSNSLIMGSDGFLYADSNVPLARYCDSKIMFYSGKNAYFENIIIPWDQQNPITSFIRAENGGMIYLDSASFTNITFKMVKNFKPSLQQILPTIIYCEEKSDIMLFNARFENMRNCRYMMTFRVSNVMVNAAYFNRIEFDQEVYLSEFKYGTSALYIQDSYLMIMDSEFSNIQSPNKGASVIYLKSLNVAPLYFIHELQLDRTIFLNNSGPGSALVIEDTNATITLSNFRNNTNTENGGGAITYLCNQKNLSSKQSLQFECICDYYRLPI